MYWAMRPQLIAAALALLMLIGTHLAAYDLGKDAIKADWEADKAAAALRLAKAEEAARENERNMQAAADEFERQKREEIERLTDKHRVLVDSLRQRPARPAVSNVPAAASNAQSAPVCTGAELHREDAEFLVREALRGDQLRAELEACYQQYDKVRNYGTRTP
jgi:hypothetical protein